jgi:hypothetical protein
MAPAKTKINDFQIFLKKALANLRVNIFLKIKISFN